MTNLALHISAIETAVSHARKVRDTRTAGIVLPVPAGPLVWRKGLRSRPSAGQREAESRPVLADGAGLAIIRVPFNPGEHVMSKGLDKKKETKKKPEKTLKEKRAEKAAKKGK